MIQCSPRLFKFQKCNYSYFSVGFSYFKIVSLGQNKTQTNKQTSLFKMLYECYKKHCLLGQKLKHFGRRAAFFRVKSHG